MKHPSCILLTGIVLAAGVALGADWPQFRGPGGSAVSVESSLPEKWGKTEGIKWKVELPGRGLSNPVIADGRIYVTACSGYRERRLHVLCFAEATGKRLWERQFTATGNTQCNRATNMAAPTPVTNGKAVYALFASGDLAALDQEGNLLWYRSLVGDYPDITNQVGMAASVVLAEGVLLVPMENAGDSFAAGLDLTTGKNLWRVRRAKTINWVTPLVFTSAGRPAVLFQTGGDTTAYDPTTGKVRWTYSGGSSIPSAAAGEGMLFLPRGDLIALRPGKDDSEPEVVWRAEKFTQGFASPVYHAGRVYGLGNVTVNCARASDGKELWRQRAEGPFDASPVIGDGKLYAVNRKGRTYVIKLGDRPTLLARNDLDETISATPAIAGGCIYLRSDRYLYCIGTKAEK